jgi:hypothetical protein
VGARGKIYRGQASALYPILLVPRPASMPNSPHGSSRRPCRAAREARPGLRLADGCCRAVGLPLPRAARLVGARCIFGRACGCVQSSVYTYAASVLVGSQSHSGGAGGASCAAAPAGVWGPPGARATAVADAGDEAP